MKLASIFLVVIFCALFLPGYLAKRDAVRFSVDMIERDGVVVKGCR